MKAPVEHVRVSAKGKEILIRVKRRTGLEHWNEICRIALCRSMANPTPPVKIESTGDSSIDMEWKTFAGSLQEELAAIILFRAKKDGVDVLKKDALVEYFREHLERGITSLQNIRSMSGLWLHQDRQHEKSD